MELLKTNPDWFREGVKIGSVYGDFPISVWNGGRYEMGFCEERYMREVVKRINSYGIPLRFTFTSPLIQKEHLADKHCNDTLKIADNGLNEVTVFSPILEEYIRKNYPSYKIISSTCKEIRNAEDVKNELAKDYKMVVLDYNWNGNFEFLSTLEPKDRIELLANSPCPPDCKRRGEHYIATAKIGIAYYESLKNKTEFRPESFVCEYGSNNTFYTAKDFKTFIKPDDLWEKYAPLGYRNFKLVSRNGSVFSLLDDYVNYLVKPERRREIYLKWLSLMFKNKGNADRKIFGLNKNINFSDAFKALAMSLKQSAPERFSKEFSPDKCNTNITNSDELFKLLDFFVYEFIKPEFQDETFFLFILNFEKNKAFI